MKPLSKATVSFLCPRCRTADKRGHNLCIAIGHLRPLHHALSIALISLDMLQAPALSFVPSPSANHCISAANHRALCFPSEYCPTAITIDPNARNTPIVATGNCAVISPPVLFPLFPRHLTITSPTRSLAAGENHTTRIPLVPCCSHPTSVIFDDPLPKNVVCVLHRHEHSIARPPPPLAAGDHPTHTTTSLRQCSPPAIIVCNTVVIASHRHALCTLPPLTAAPISDH